MTNKGVCMTGMLERLKFLFLTTVGCLSLVACPSPPPTPSGITLEVETRSGRTQLPAGFGLATNMLVVYALKVFELETGVNVGTHLEGGDFVNKCFHRQKHLFVTGFLEFDQSH